jgi:hypothetical protein
MRSSSSYPKSGENASFDASSKSSQNLSKVHAKGNGREHSMGEGEDRLSEGKKVIFLYIRAYFPARSMTFRKTRMKFPPQIFSISFSV